MVGAYVDDRVLAGKVLMIPLLLLVVALLLLALILYYLLRDVSRR
jgi:hypothetical protein